MSKNASRRMLVLFPFLAGFACPTPAVKYVFVGLALLLFTLIPSSPAKAQPTWIQLSPAGGSPTPRYLHTAVPDTTTNRMVIFGGGSGYPVPAMLNDLWVLTSADGLVGTPTWTQLNPTGAVPIARGTHTSVYDPASNRMIVFGGNRSVAFCGGALNDTWVLSNANGLGLTPSWQQLTPAGGPPSARLEHTAVYDPASNRMIVFGGGPGCASANAEVWVLTNANGLGGAPVWTQLSPIGGPAALYANSYVYDPGSNRMIVFGGCNNATCPQDTWVLSNANGLGGTPTWTKLSPTGGGPSARIFPTAVYDPAANRMTVFGGEGCTGTGVCNDVWVLSNANGLGGTPNWTKLSPGGGTPSPREGHSAVLNPASNRMTVFGGLTNAGGCCSSLGDVWVLTNANGIMEVNTPGKVTGGGYIQPDGTMSPATLSITNGSNASIGGKATFGFVVQFTAGGANPTGNLQYNDHGASVTIKALSFTLLAISNGVCGANTHAKIKGSATVTGPSGVPSTQDSEVEVDDCSSTRSGPDTFKITTLGTTPYMAAGPVVGGNITIH